MGVDRYNLEELHRSSEALLTEWRTAARHGAESPAPETEPPGGAPAVGATAPHESRPSAHAAFLGGVGQDADGFAFTQDLLDAVIGAGDPFAAALGLRDASKHLPEGLPMRDRLALRAGGLASLGLPWAVLPVARKWLRERVSPLVLSLQFPDGALDRTLAQAITEAVRRHTEQGTRTAIALTGNAVLGETAIAREVQRLSWLAQHPHITDLVIDPERVCASTTPWGDEAAAERAATALRPLMVAALRNSVRVTLRPSSFRGALLAPELLVRICADTAFDQLCPGVWVPAELADSGSIADRLIRWSRARVREGGQPLTIWVGNAGCDGQERISSLLTGLPVPTLADQAATTAQTIRLFELVLGAARKGDARVLLATEDPGVLALGTELITTSDLPQGGAALVVRAGTADDVLRGIREASRERENEAAPAPEAAGEVRETETETGAGGELGAETEAEPAGTGDSSSPKSTADADADAGAGAGTDADAGPPTATHDSSAALPELWQLLPVNPHDEYAGLLNALVSLSAEACAPNSDLALAAGFARQDDAGERVHAEALRGAITAAAQPFPAPHRTQNRAREWDPTERDSALFYRPAAEDHGFDTSGLTAAVLGLSRGETGQIVRETVGRTLPIPVISHTGFANEPLTDALVQDNREWMRRVLQSATELRQQWRAGAQSLDHDTAAVGPAEEYVDAALAAGAGWRALRPVDRSTRVRRLALGVAAARDRFIAIGAAENGRPVGVLDGEVNGAIDAARYLGQQAASLGAVRGAEFVPDAVTVVVCESGVPLDERAEALTASLAAGSAVICVVHRSVWHSTVALAEEWVAAGLPERLVTVVNAGNTVEGVRVCAASLSTDVRVDRAVVLGGRETANRLVRSRPALRVNGQFRALGSVAITPSAAHDDAIRDVVRSAFGVAAESLAGARSLVLLGNTARSREVLDQLADAVRSLCVGDTGEPAPARSVLLGAETGGTARGCADPLAVSVGPLLAPPSAAGLRALTVLYPGEEWLVQPEALDDEWRLWRPGVRLGVAPDSPFWGEAAGMPVIGVTTARTVSELITVQSQLCGGTVAGLFATDPSEVLPWLNGVQAARLVVGHATAPAAIERQPSGGWGAASQGTGQLAGGPHRLVGLGSWRLREGTQSPTLHLRGLSPEVRELIELSQPDLDYRTFDRVRRAALSDSLAWRTELGKLSDSVGLGVRQHLVRRHPVSTHIRHAEGASLGDLVRVLAAALLVNAPVTVSSGSVLPPALTDLLHRMGAVVALERDDDWLERLAVHGVSGGSEERASGGHRGQGVRGWLASLARIPVSTPEGQGAGGAQHIRLIGGDAVRTAEWLGGLTDVTLWAEPVTMAGPVELLSFVRDQAMSVNANRNGLYSSPRGVAGWIDELEDRVYVAPDPQL